MTKEKLNTIIDLNARIEILEIILNEEKGHSFVDSGGNPLARILNDIQLFGIEFIDELRNLIINKLEIKLKELENEFKEV